MKMPVVALIGRPNVGKSTIFNKMVGRKLSIIEDIPGVTRDRVYGRCEYKDYKFHLIDTGGIELGENAFNKEIKMQAELAIDDADVVVFVVDGKEGLTSDDFLVRDMLKKVSNKVILAINKCDSKKIKENEYDFYELGFENMIKVSGEQGDGISDLLDIIVKNFNLYEKDLTDTVKFSIIGRPNVGKSSLVNAILNEDRVIVSDIAGTTRDAIDTEFNYNGSSYTVIDTAGMRKRGKIYENIEKYSLLRSLKAIDRSDVCVLVINAEEGIIEHDKHIASYAIDAGKAIVIAVNKWDLIEDKDNKLKEWKKDIESNFAFMSYAKVVFLSAKTKKRVHTLMPEVLNAYENSKKQIKTNLINKVIEDAYELNLPPSYKGKRLKIYFTSQVRTNPPTFNIQVNSKSLIHFSYERYLENKIRESFDFSGTPIVLNFKNKGEQ
ncbi:MAG: ribosome biogenesis GTPase Der [bacterium]|nr:ribosome biogenesis GTPase Der [bacterium]